MSENTATGSRIPIVSPRELTRAMADFQQMRPGPGLVRIAMSLIIIFPLVAFCLTTQNPWAFFFSAALLAVALGSILILTHDAIHHTLTGWRWLDEAFPRLLSFPLFWPHGVYSELHKLHHKMNGADPVDPERVQWSDAEYERAGPVGRFLARHQFSLAVFLYGGLGMLYSLLRNGIYFAPKSKGVRRQLVLDGVFIVVFNVVLYTALAQYDMALRFFVMWIVFERIGGGIMQFRSHILHYGLWGKEANFFETQIFNSRNIVTNKLVSLYFVHLNFHSVHHAFPTVPFYNLEKAHRRLQALYSGERRMVEEEGYAKTAWRLMSSLHLAKTRA